MKTIKRLTAIILSLAIVFTAIPAAAGSLDAHAASSYWKNFNAKSTGETSVTISWSQLTKKQRNRITGIAVFRNGKAVRNLGKTAKNYNDTGLQPGTSYKYNLKTFKVSKQKQWYNKKTGKWQTKKPAKKYRGKSRKVTTYTYKNLSPAKTVTTKKSSSGGNDGTVDNNGTFLDVSEAYTYLNAFRTDESNQWYWASDNTNKVYVTGLGELQRDTVLEEVAKIRAEEQWIQYYVNGNFTHDRPDGSSCWTAYPAGSNPLGENLHWNLTDCEGSINVWAEEIFGYEYQGHRRNMLNPNATRVGIACYIKNGCACWAMCLGY